jgi:hypothetical protein
VFCGLDFLGDPDGVDHALIFHLSIPLINGSFSDRMQR